jgi:hypothetical protein
VVTVGLPLAACSGIVERPDVGPALMTDAFPELDLGTRVRVFGASDAPTDPPFEGEISGYALREIYVRPVGLPEAARYEPSDVRCMEVFFQEHKSSRTWIGLGVGAVGAAIGLASANPSAGQRENVSGVVLRTGAGALLGVLAAALVPPNDFYEEVFPQQTGEPCS